MVVIFVLGLVGGFTIASLLWILYLEADHEEKKKLWRLEEDEAREKRGEPLIPKNKG